METQTLYQQAIKFATAKHLEQNQLVPGTNLPYVVHLSNVAMEILIAGANSIDFNLDFAVQVALLHDTLEDTASTFAELEFHFGHNIAEAVNALSKNEQIPKDRQMFDCLKRIHLLPKEVWAVKLADRITNLQPPPSQWNIEKRIKYLDEAKTILEELGIANDYLAQRLKKKIGEYQNYIR